MRMVITAHMYNLMNRNSQKKSKKDEVPRNPEAVGITSREL